MQWNNSHNAGFSCSPHPWLPINDNYQQVNQENEMSDPHSYLNLYKRLILLRKKYKSLSFGKYIPLPIPAKGVLAFLREYQSERALTLLNFDSTEKVISLPFTPRVILCSTHPDTTDEISLTNFTLRENEGVVFLLS